MMYTTKGKQKKKKTGEKNVQKSLKNNISVFFYQDF